MMTPLAGAQGAKLPLTGRNILIVEDEYLIADEARSEFQTQGANVIGPAASVEQGLRLVETNRIDAGLLDIRLQGNLVFPVAQLLLDSGIPFFFVTGYDAMIMPDQFRELRRFTKPADYQVIAKALSDLL
jgi:DNA-binding LytR/AlgR family response regulator